MNAHSYVLYIAAYHAFDAAEREARTLGPGGSAGTEKGVSRPILFINFKLRAFLRDCEAPDLNFYGMQVFRWT